MSEHIEILELVPLYALDALEGDELVEFETHLSMCAICQDELAEAHTVTASLVDDAEVPVVVWDRIVAEIDGRHDGNVVDLGSERSRRRPWLVLTTVAAAAALVFGGIAVAQRSLINSLDGDGAVVAAAETAAEEPGSFVGDFEVDGAVVAQVVLDDNGQGFVLPEEALEPLDETRTYQLWVITADEKVISAGVLGADPGASTFTWNGDVSGFALTTEVAGGVVTSEGDLVSVVTEA